MSGGYGSPRDAALTYRQTFINRWQRFVRANFDSPEHAAHVFGVDGTTARKWWDGLHAPSGFVVGFAYERFPAEARECLRGAA